MNNQKRNIIIILLSCIFFTSAIAQENPKIKRSEFKSSDKGFKDAWQNIKDGDDYYKAGEGTYRLALEKYWSAYEYNDANAALNYKIGVCYLFTGKNRVEALNFLQKAEEIDSYIANDINYLLGRAHHLNLNFDEAIKEYNNYKNSLTEIYSSRDIEKKQLNEKVEKRVTECKYGKELIKNPKRIILRNLGENINSAFDDYDCVFYPDYKKMFFTSRRSNTTKEERFEGDNKFKEDIYLAEFKNNKWQLASHPGKPLNTKHNDRAVALTNNAQKLYIYRGNENNGDIMVSKIKEGEWQNTKNIDSKLKSKYWETTMALSKDGNTFYFISNMEENSIGGKDIFYSEKDGKGRWQEPKNLSAKVNSPYDEEGLAFDEEEDTLYFSSKGHNSMGGYDIFKTWKEPSGRWAEPVNLGYPVNTPEDEIFYKPSQNPKQYYYSAVRDMGHGGFDMYKIIYLGAEKEMLLATEDDTLAWSVKPKPELFYRKPDKMIIDTSLYLTGKVTDANTSEPIKAKLELINMEESQVDAKTVTDEDGKYKIKLPDNRKKFGVEVNSTGYMFYTETINLSDNQFTNDIAKRNFELEKVEVGAKMVLKNIYFSTGKATLKPESYEELNRVVKFLENNPSVEIEVSGHTDNVGSYRYNKKLSKDRAKSVVEYLESHDIDKRRLNYEGYAFDQPIETNETEEGRAKNRRVEFKILSTK